MTSVLISKEKLDELESKLISDLSYFRNKNIVYIDYPTHQNIGDHLIYWGAMAALKHNNNKVIGQFSANTYSFKAVSALVKENNAIIVCHGGGNFGDLYPQHHNLRKTVIQQFPETIIIIMPQSVHFEDKAKIANDLAVFAKENVYVHVRDKESYALLKDYKVQVLLTPDCAQALVNQTFSDSRKASKETKTLALRRRDIEAVNDASGAFDWQDILSPQDEFVYKAMRRLTSRLWMYKYSSMVHNWYSKRLMFRAIEHFNDYNLVDTDRLHGFILAILLGLPVLHSDNSYKKIGKYKKAWNIPSV